MKKLLFICLLVTLFASCQKEDVSTLVGTWKVQQYMDGGVDKTSELTEYTFDFQSNKKLVAKFGTNTVEGTWDNTSSAQRLIIKISGTQKLDNISDDWILFEQTATKITLKDELTSTKDELHLVKM